MADIYVATTGNDTTGDGTSGTPYATPGKAAGDIASDGDRIVVKAGTYNLSSVEVNVAGGPVSLPSAIQCQIIGYETTVDDGCPTGNRPVINASAQTGTGVINMNGAYADHHFAAHLSIDGNSNFANGFLGNNTTVSEVTTVENCVVTGCTDAGFENVNCVRCYSHANGKGFERGNAIYCLALDNTGNGFVQSAAGFFVGCVSDGNAGYGFTVGQGYAVNCSAIDSTLSGFHSNNAGVFVNCISWSNGAYGFAATGTARTGAQCTNCASGDNTTDDYYRTNAPVLDAITLTANPFTDSVNNDYSLNNTAGGGVLCRELGIVTATQENNGVMSVGAIQLSASGGSPSGLASPIFRNPIITG